MTSNLHGLQESDRSSTPEGALAVLVQITLPIVLVLAFVVFTELRAAQKEREERRQDPQGERARAERDVALISLQQQLLAKAIGQIISEDEATIGIAQYAVVQITPTDVLDARIHPRFAEISRALAQRFATSARTNYSRNLSERVEATFKALAIELVTRSPSLADRGLDRLLRITRENDQFRRDALSGAIEGLFETGANIQRQLILDWFKDDKALAAARKESDELFNKAVAGDPAAVQAFQNLRVADLQTRLRQLGVALLDDVIREVS